MSSYGYMFVFVCTCVCCIVDLLAGPHSSKGAVRDFVLGLMLD